MSAVGAAKVRFLIANSRIMGNHTVGIGESDEEIIREEGFVSWNEYWNVALAQEFKVSAFVSLLETHLLDQARTAEEIKGAAVPTSMLIMSSLREAFENGESWLFQARSGGRTLGDFRLRPREAAEWFMRRPLDRDKLPETLRAFLKSSGGTMHSARLFNHRDPARLDALAQCISFEMRRAGVEKAGKPDQASAAKPNV